MTDQELHLSPNVEVVLRKRYQGKDEHGEVTETPAQMFRRVARNLAEADREFAPKQDAEKTEEEFYRVMTSFDMLPNSPTLMNAGRRLQQLSACYVVPVPDDLGGIFDSAKAQAMIQQSGGGTGFSFSRLRPKNDIVGSTGGIASGPVSFMATIFNATTEAIKQGGTRRGANMGILAYNHPDIMEFIHCKDDDVSVQNFNISVGATKEFMDAVAARGSYELINPRTGKSTGTIEARMVFDQIVKGAWKTGDPGLIFLDRFNNDARSNPVPSRGPIESSNPCGEQPLYPWDSCNLGSISLSHFVRDGHVDYGRLGEVVRVSVHLLDNVVSMNRYPLPQIAEVSLAIRRIGLGVMGWADLLIELGIPYDSKEAVELAGSVMSFIQKQADDASSRLAEIRGNFPDWGESTYGAKFGSARPMRNSTRTTQAPTGTIARIADVSFGIEPLLALAYTSNILDGEKLQTVNSAFERIAHERGFYSKDLMQQIEESGSCQSVAAVPDDVKRLFKVAGDVTPEWHVRTQAAFQKYIDNAVSKTVGLPNNARVEDVREAYWLAYELGCKGITVYRDGSKGEQVINTGATRKAHAGGDQSELRSRSAFSVVMDKRPDVLDGRTHKIRTHKGNLYVTINRDPATGCVVELFTALGKAGGDQAADSEAITRLATGMLRSGTPVEKVIAHLEGITSEPVWSNGTLVRSVPDGIAVALKSETGKVEMKSDVPSKAEARRTGDCPKCNVGVLDHQENCEICRNCGYSKCE